MYDIIYHRSEIQKEMKPSPKIRKVGPEAFSVNEISIRFDYQ